MGHAATSTLQCGCHNGNETEVPAGTAGLNNAMQVVAAAGTLGQQRYEHQTEYPSKIAGVAPSSQHDLNLAERNQELDLNRVLASYCSCGESVMVDPNFHETFHIDIISLLAPDHGEQAPDCGELFDTLCVTSTMPPKEDHLIFPVKHTKGDFIEGTTYATNTEEVIPGDSGPGPLLVPTEFKDIGYDWTVPSSQQKPLTEWQQKKIKRCLKPFLRACNAGVKLQMQLDASGQEKLKDRFHSIILQPGQIGMGISEDGKVRSITPGGQEELAGVKAGWRFHTIKGEPYSQELLDKFRAGQLSYTAVFLKEDDRNVDARLRLAKDGIAFHLSVGGVDRTLPLKSIRHVSQHEHSDRLAVFHLATRRYVRFCFDHKDQAAYFGTCCKLITKAARQGRMSATSSVSSSMPSPVSSDYNAAVSKSERK